MTELQALEQYVSKETKRKSKLKKKELIGNNSLLSLNKPKDCSEINVGENELCSEGKLLKEIQTNLLVTKLDKNEETENRPLSSKTFPHKRCRSSEELSYQDTVDKFYRIVRFTLYEEIFVTTFQITATIEKVKKSLIDVLELEKDSIILQQNNIELKSNLTLADFEVKPYSKIDFQVSSSNGEEGKALILAKVKENIPTLDVITVHAIDRSGKVKDIIVEIENQFNQKEWLGGYFNKQNKIEYHNALCQTAPKPRTIFKKTQSEEVVPLFYHRDTQTPLAPKEVHCATVVNKATQMWKTDLFIQSKTDKIMTTKVFEKYEEFYKTNSALNAIIKIQRKVRSWSKSKKFKNLIILQKQVINDIKTQKAQILKEQADKERQIITNAAYPVKRDDFYTLYLMVGKWWVKEWKRICDLRDRESKKAEAVMLLQKEVKLLENIEKHRIVSKNETLKKERMRLLEQTSRPITFKNKKGEMTTIDDLNTQKAREFKEIYSRLICKDITPKSRIDFLLIFKQLFISHYKDYEYTFDLVSLVEQEIDLITIGIKPDKLKGIHKRLEQLFMNFLEQKEFNPKAENYKKLNMPKTIHALFPCTTCHKLLPASKFPVHVRLNAYTMCSSCVWLKNIGHQRVDMSPYLKLLKYVQNSEMERCCHSAVCFIFQPTGMCYLTNVIWHGQSAISGCRDLSKMQHVRWISDVEWAPWNTILLTDQEVKCHVSIPNVFNFYDEVFIEKVRQKHIIARKHFIPLLKMDHEIRSSGDWSSITDSGPFLHPSHVDGLAHTEDYDDI